MTEPMDRLVMSLGAHQVLGVEWHAPLLNHSGYADEARAFVLGVQERGWPVRAHPLYPVEPAFLDGFDPVQRGRLEAVVSEPPHRYSLGVHHMPAHAIGPAGHVRNVARTMFETDRLPPSWVQQLNAVDEVWVPSAFNLETFRRAGVRTPVHVVPGGVDADRYRPGLEPLALTGTRKTAFLSVFEWSYRKAWDVLLRAWAMAFGPTDDVSLVIRSYALDPDARSSPDWVSRRIDDFLRRMGRTRASVAPIVVLEQPVPTADMPRLYASADAYVGISRGEGWGRPLLEAMATGLPTIGTRWSGNLEFMDDDNSLLVDVQSIDAVGRREELAFYRGHRWARPSARHLARLLRHVAEDPSAARALGQRARADVERRWTWSSALEVVSERLVELDAGLRPRRAPSRPDAPRVRWRGEQFAHHSLASVNREICRRLVQRGAVELEAVTSERRSPDPDADPSLGPLAAVTGSVLAARADVEVRHQWPPDWTPPGSGAWVVMQPWEYGGLPDAWLPPLLRQVDEVWCYSSYVRDVYRDSGVPEERLHVIPLGVDPAVFRPDGDRYPLRTRRGTKLLFVGGTIPRKGTDLLLRAYAATFSRADDVCLVVKSFGSESFYADASIDAEIRRLQDDPSAPEIELISDDLMPRDVAALYRTCDVLAHPYRGEGFGLPIVESMASGLPVITTGAGAALDYCTDDRAFLVPAEQRPIAGDAFGPSAAGYWLWEPDVEELGRLMELAVSDRDLALRNARAAREHVLEALTWDRTAAEVEERLCTLAGTEPTRSWAVLRDRAASPFPLDTGDRVTFAAQVCGARSVRDLVVGYARSLGPAEPTTLVLYAEDGSETSPDDIVEAVTAALRGAGVDPDRAPDMLLIPQVLGPEDARRLRAAVDSPVELDAGVPLPGWWHGELERALHGRSLTRDALVGRARQAPDLPHLNARTT
ncbi:MAG: glycosyltransferase [Acidimicrobiales bacterium]